MLLKISDLYERAGALLVSLKTYGPPGSPGTSEELTRAIAALELSEATYAHAMTIIGEFEELSAGK